MFFKRFKKYFILLSFSLLLIFIYQSATNESNTNKKNLDNFINQQKEFPYTLDNLFENTLNQADDHLIWFVQVCPNSL